MILKTQTKNIFILLGIITSIILSLLVVDRSEIFRIKEDLIQYGMSLDLGFSMRQNLYEPHQKEIESDSGAYSSSLFKLFSSLPKILKYKLGEDNFERIDIDIKYLDYQQIMLDRERAQKNGVLKNPSYVNANIKYKNSSYRAKVRLKGYGTGHWDSKYRMSLLVSLKDGKSILGNRKFSILKPRERQYPFDYVFQSLVKSVGNLSSSPYFGHFYLNGNDWGIMYIEEHMTKELLEKQRRKESIIVRFSNDDLLEYQSLMGNEDFYPYYKISDPSLTVHLYDENKYLIDNQNRKLYSYIAKEQINFESHLYNIDSLTKSYLLASAWGSWHSILDYNSRYYLNPYTLNLEPITSDQLWHVPLQGLHTLLHYDLPDQYKTIMESKKFITNLPLNIKTIQSNILTNTQKYFDEAASAFPVDQRLSADTVVTNLNKVLSNKETYLFNPLLSKITPDKFDLPSAKQASFFKDHLHVRHYTDGLIELYNLVPDEVLIKKITYEDKPIPFKTKFIESYTRDNSPLIIKTKYLGIRDNKIKVQTEYQGQLRETKNGISLITEDLVNPIMADNFKCQSFCTVKDGNYFIKEGEWIIREPVVINGNLTIQKGVSLKFYDDSYLLVRGSILASGTTENPIKFKAYSNFWKGIYVLGAQKKSLLENVIIENVRALEDGLLKLTGAITFYRSDVDFYNVTIDKVSAEDAINIIESSFSMNSILIKNTGSDALDSDFSIGKIDNSKFQDIGGDALDFSGSTVQINNVDVFNVKDKAVSGGEESLIEINKGNFHDVGIGVASKDASNIVVTDTQIKNYRLFGVMSYVKKGFYSKPSSISLYGCNIDKQSPYLRQNGTFMLVDGLEIEENSFDVDKLYSSQEI